MSFDVRDDSALQYLPPNSDQDNADAAPIARGGLPNQQTSRDHPVEQTRHPAGGARNISAKPAYLE